MDSVVPSTLPGHISSLKQYDYDIEKAKELLKEAGMENGFEVEFMYLANSTNICWQNSSSRCGAR